MLDHTFTPKELATLPEKIADPIAVIYDKRTGKANASESTVDVIVEMTAASGKQVLVAVQVGGNSHINGLRIDTNKVATVHGNTDCLTRLVDAINETEKGNVAVFYINNDKTTKVLQSAGNPIPRGLSNLDGFINSINDPGSPVKSRFSDVTETQQFKRWFGDWQNHPENASKVVNDDGTPMVVYHGTNAEFTAFDKRKAKNGVFGKGFYFTPSKGRAKAYGSAKILETYLNIRTPYMVTDSLGFTSEDYQSMQKQIGVQDKITDQNVAKILQQKGYDGIIAEDGNGSIREVVVFKSTQIKSATDNIGIFDGSNPDIRYSLSEQGTAPAGGYRITGEDIALAPTKEDIAQMEQGIATAPAALRNDVDAEELGAPTREDILQMEMERELYGDWRMTDPLDRKMEKLYRLMLREQISEEDYNAQLVKADRQYQQRGSRVEDALERIQQAYSKHQAVTADESAAEQKAVEAVLGKKGALPTQMGVNKSAELFDRIPLNPKKLCANL